MHYSLHGEVASALVLVDWFAWCGVLVFHIHFPYSGIISRISLGHFTVLPVNSYLVWVLDQHSIAYPHVALLCMSLSPESIYNLLNELVAVIWLSDRDPRGGSTKKEVVRAQVSPSSGDVGCLPTGLSLTRFASSKNTVCNSQKVITLSPTATVIAFFTDFTRAFEVPFCHGASARRNFHSIPFVAPNAVSSSQSQNEATFLGSSFAAVNWVPLSEIIFAG